jgi:pyrroline-5-carboxylate reductase
MKITVIGCGVMGKAFAKHFARQHFIFLYDKSFEKANDLAKEIGGKAVEKVKEAIQGSDVILLAVKPKDFESVAKMIHSDLTKDQLVISILAGASLQILRKHLPDSPLLRVTPNLALLYGQGVLGVVEDSQLSDDLKKLAETLLSGMGLVAWLAENKMDALNALAASGLGFFFLIMEGFIEGGVAIGLTEDEAKEYALKTLEGAASLMRETKKHPAELKLQIASPAGTTIAGLKKMEEYGVKAGIINALIAAHEKAVHMFNP